MLPTAADKCEEDLCAPPGHTSHSRAPSPESFSTLAFSSLPFIITFLIVSIVVLRKVFPLVSDVQQSKDDQDELHYLPADAPPSLRQSHKDHGVKTTRQKVVAISFSTTIALAAVLAELILCEISNSLNPAARALALKFIVPTLLFFLIILIPFLELQSIVSGAGWSFQRTRNSKIPKIPWLLQSLGLALWLGGFWWLGKGLPGTYIYERASQKGKGLSEACLERVGIIGISLMALLSGFASVSASWQTFGAKTRPVTESDIARKQAGLDATNDMLAAKRSRLRVLQKKIKDTYTEGFMTKVIGTIRGTADTQELKSLELEIAGLSKMAQSLSSSLSILQTRYTASRRASSPLGKFVLTPASYGFAIYCIYRILTMTLTMLRRALFPSPSQLSSSATDPINRVLSILAKHVDPTKLDQLALSRQISFGLSGFILLASFNSVLQTFHIFTKYTPSLLYQAQANLALIIAQISATYVISSALLLRSNLPTEVGSVVSEALGSPLEPGFVDRWFEGWFLIASFLTTLGIWLGKRLGGLGDWDDWDFEGDVEMGQKRSS